MNDPTAQRKKYALVRWFREYNAKHPAAPLHYWRPQGSATSPFDPETPKVGTPARETLKIMQRACKLEHISGQFDRATMAILLPPKPNIRHDVMATAMSQLGIHETPDGSNWGPVAKYLGAAGIGGPGAWCAAFVTWDLLDSGFRRAQLPGNPAWVPAWEDWGRKHSLLVPARESRLGDLWIWNWDGGQADHIGLCDDTKPGDPVAYYLDGNVGAHGGSVTEGSRPASGIEVVISLEKLWALR